MNNDHEAADDENVPDRDGGDSELEREVDNIMDWVFGEETDREQ